MLVPVTAYTEERMRASIGSATKGYLPHFRRATSGIGDPNLYKISRTSACDGAGNFEFSELPSGSYFILAEITWGVPQRGFTLQQGGTLMEKVSVENAATRKIVMTM